MAVAGFRTAASRRSVRAFPPGGRPGAALLAALALAVAARGVSAGTAGAAGGPPPGPATSISTCQGPGGALLYTNLACPGGFVPVETRAVVPRVEPSLPFICEFAGSLGAFEVESGVAEARARLAAAEGARDAGAVERWERCLASLVERGRSLAERRPSEPAAPAPPQAPPVLPACASGVFRTEDGALSIEAFFTNRDTRPCGSVRAYCLFHLFTDGLGDYRESGTLDFDGRIEPGATVRLGRLESRGGPPGRSIAWSWCRFR